MNNLSLDGVFTGKYSEISLGTHRAHEPDERQQNPFLDHGLEHAQHSSQIQDYCDDAGKMTKQRRGGSKGTRN